MAYPSSITQPLISFSWEEHEIESPVALLMDGILRWFNYKQTLCRYV